MALDTQVRSHPGLPPRLNPRGGAPSGRRPGRRLFNLVALTLSLGILVLSFGGYIVVRWFDGSIARVHLNLGQDRPEAASKGSENWLLVGTDSSTTDNYGERSGLRSDTTILAHLDADGTTTNISFPRDTLVTIPEYTDPETKVTKPEHKDKFNSAISEGGPSLLIRTVEKLTNVRVDHYVAVNLDGFAAISKALNGVEVCILPSTYKETGPDGGTITNISDGFSGFYGRVGKQTVAGESAVAFVRQRHGLPGGDIDRIARQQQFLGSVFRTATQTKVLFNPVAVTRLLGAIKDSLTLDDSTSLQDLEKLAFRLKGVDPSKVTFETIPQRQLQPTDTDLGRVENTPQGLQLWPTGQTDSVGAVQILETEPFNAMIAKIQDKPAPAASSSAKVQATPTTAAPKPLTVAPDQILVTVENGTTRSGLAGTVTAALKRGGFQTGPAGNADSRAYSQTVVRYESTDLEKARTVQAALPGSALKEDASVAGGIAVTLGTGYSYVQPVTIGSTSGAIAPPAAPAPAPTSTAPPVTAQSNTCTN